MAKHSKEKVLSTETFIYECLHITSGNFNRKIFLLDILHFVILGLHLINNVIFIFTEFDRKLCFYNRN